MFSSFRSIGIWTATILISGFGLSVANEFIEVEILQLKNDRLYFAVGTESLVFPNSRIDLIRDGDTIYSGKIDHSAVGVSYSGTLEFPLDSIDLDSCTSLVEIAERNSSQQIRFGCLNVLPSNLVNSYELTRFVSDVENRFVAGQEGKHGGVLLEYFAGGDEISIENGYNSISYRPRYYSGWNDNLLCARAPFYAALVPNLNRDLNENGFLTVSLYHQFNEEHLDQIFDGHEPLPMTTLYGPDSSASRFYPHDPRQGERLFRRIKKRPREISIGLMDPALKGVAEYFADLLARERIRTVIRPNDRDADIYLMFVPFHKTKRAASLEYLLNNLREAGSEKRLHRELLPQIADRLQKLHGAATQETELEYMRAVDRIMKEDLGLFPLFQPTIYMVTSPETHNVMFDSNNFPNYELMELLLLPGTETVVPPEVQQ